MLTEPWPWYISGPLIGLTIPLLLYFKNKAFGVSSSFTHICTLALKSNKTSLKEYKVKNSWNLHFALGIILSGIIYHVFIEQPNSKHIESAYIFGQSTHVNSTFPSEFFDLNYIFSFQGFIFLILGAFLVGFGSRYANGCTSGHAIMGLSNRQLTSLIAVLGFFIGGLIITYGLRNLIG